MSITDEILDILCNLIAIPSTYPPGNTTAISEYIANRLKLSGYETEIICKTPLVQNVVARMGKGRPSIVFNSHVDTIAITDKAAWKTSPFEGTLVDGRVYGLGAGNCKGSAAVQIWLAEEIARNGGPKKGEILFTFVGDEENLGSNGLAYLRQLGLVKPDLLICGAQTQLQTIFEERGVIWVEVLTNGISAHAGEPKMGDNAINRMVRIINKLFAKLLPVIRERKRGKLQSTMNIGIIEGGVNTNAVPDHCRMEIDRRLLPEEKIDDALAEIKSIVAEAGEPTGSWEVSLKTGTQGFSSSSNSAFIRAFHESIIDITGDVIREVVAIGASDARYFVEDDIVLMTFGPGHAKDGHKANEFVPLEELEMAALIQKSVIKKILGFAN